MADPFAEVFGSVRGSQRLDPPAPDGPTSRDVLDELIGWMDSEERRMGDDYGPAEPAVVAARGDQLGVEVQLMRTGAEPPDGMRAYTVRRDGDGIFGVIVEAYVTIAPHAPYYMLYRYSR